MKLRLVTTVIFIFQSVGCTVEGKSPQDVIMQIDDHEIEVPEE